VLEEIYWATRNSPSAELDDRFCGAFLSSCLNRRDMAEDCIVIPLFCSSSLQDENSFCERLEENRLIIYVLSKYRSFPASLGLMRPLEQIKLSVSLKTHAIIYKRIRDF